MIQLGEDAILRNPRKEGAYQNVGHALRKLAEQFDRQMTDANSQEKNKELSRKRDQALDEAHDVLVRATELYPIDDSAHYDLFLTDYDRSLEAYPVVPGSSISRVTIGRAGARVLREA